MIIRTDDKKEYSFSAYVCYGRITKEDPNMYHHSRKVVENIVEESVKAKIGLRSKTLYFC